MPLAKRAVGDANCVEIGNVCVEMETESVIGEVFRCRWELSETQPWNHAVKRIERQKPEGRQVNENVAGRVLRSRGFRESLRSQHDECPEDQTTHPSGKTMDSLEGIVSLLAELWVGKDDNGCEEEQQKIC